MMNADLLALKVHVDEQGIVWTLYSDRPPFCTGKKIIPFLLTSPGRYCHIRMMGCPSNAQMILAQFLRMKHAGEGVLEVCSPQVCRSSEERHDPKRALLAMRQWLYPASMGGWHAVQRNELASYVLISQLRRGEERQLEKLVEAHIAWPALSFVPFLNKKECAKLLATVIDPRWYIDFRVPSRGSKLRSFLGLTLPIMTDVVAGKVYTPKHELCKMVLNCWWTHDDKKLIEKPDHFLQRIVLQMVDKGRLNHGFLRGSQTFIEYLRLTWLAALGSGRNQSDALFVPSYFFNNKHEVAAFEDHMRKAIDERVKRFAVSGDATGDTTNA
jgi:hypothetical protein